MPLVLGDELVGNRFYQLKLDVLVPYRIMCRGVYWGAQIAPHFMARGVDPRKDHPKDASIPFVPKSHTADRAEI